MAFKQLTVAQSVTFAKFGFGSYREALHAWNLCKLRRLKSSRKTATGRLGEDSYERMDIKNGLYGLRTDFNAGRPDWIYQLTEYAKDLLGSSDPVGLEVKSRPITTKPYSLTSAHVKGSKNKHGRIVGGISPKFNRNGKNWSLKLCTFVGNMPSRVEPEAGAELKRNEIHVLPPNDVIDLLRWILYGTPSQKEAEWLKLIGRMTPIQRPASPKICNEVLEMNPDPVQYVTVTE